MKRLRPRALSAVPNGVDLHLTPGLLWVVAVALQERHETLLKPPLHPLCAECQAIRMAERVMVGQLLRGLVSKGDVIAKAEGMAPISEALAEVAFGCDVPPAGGCH